MDCARARDLLPELALGLERSPELAAHLAWCAACRREAAELEEGAAVLAHAAAAEPPPGLEERVVRAVTAAAARRPRRRSLVALVAAFAMLAVSGWGAAIATRETLPDPAVSRAEAGRAAREFELIVEEIGGPVREAVLRSREGSPAGRALLYDTGTDGSANWVLVFAGGLEEEAGPYRARAIGGGSAMTVGRLWPSSPDRLAGYKLFGGETGELTDLVVVDREGAVVLRGAFTAP